MLPKRGLTAFSYAAVKRDMPTEMANIERDALAFIHVVGLVSAVDMLLEPEIVLGLGRVSEIRSHVFLAQRQHTSRPDAGEICHQGREVLEIYSTRWYDVD